MEDRGYSRSYLFGVGNVDMDMEASEHEAARVKGGATVAKERWKILRSAILSSTSCKSGNSSVSNVSVRKFSSFGLFCVSSAESAQEHPPPRAQNDSDIELSGTWLRYSLKQTSETLVHPEALIKVITQSTSLQDMMGFNNTGNVCIWPSEEILAYYCLKHCHLFREKTICELGGGMTSLAGVMLASTQLPSHVFLTDGNTSSVENITYIIAENSRRFGDTVVTSEVLCWDESFLDNHTPHDLRFDWVICADCLFFEDLHSNLIQTIAKLLRPGGKVLIFAPERSGTMEKFVSRAQKVFKVDREDSYDDIVREKHKELLESRQGLYKPDLHYPVLLWLTQQ